MKENIDKLKRAARYLLQPGNILYWGGISILFIISALQKIADSKTAAAIYSKHNVSAGCMDLADSAAENIEPACALAILEINEKVPGHYAMVLLGIIMLFFFFCKMFDNILRLSEGLEEEPVPFTPTSISSYALPLKYMLGIFILIIAAALLGIPFSLPGSIALSFGYTVLISLAFYFFNPAIMMNLIGNNSIGSMIRPAGWIDVIKNMGIQNYLAILLAPAIAAMLAGFVVGIIILLIPGNTLDAIIIGITQIYFSALGYTYIGYFMREKPRQGLSEEEQRILHEADTYRMEEQEKQQFAQDLLAADALRLEGGFEQMENLLLPYTGEHKNLGTYFPAYRRLYEFYAVHRRYDTLQALEWRLIEAAVQGNERCYRCVRKAVENTALDDPARLPADWVLPLAKMATNHHDYDIVLALTRHFAQRHPDHQHILENYYCAARALDKKGNRDAALRLLQQIIQRYPEHPKIAQVRRSYNLLQQQTGSP